MELVWIGAYGVFALIMGFSLSTDAKPGEKVRSFVVGAVLAPVMLPLMAAYFIHDYHKHHTPFGPFGTEAQLKRQLRNLQREEKLLELRHEVIAAESRVTRALENL